MYICIRMNLAHEENNRRVDWNMHVYIYMYIYICTYRIVYTSRVDKDITQMCSCPRSVALNSSSPAYTSNKTLLHEARLRRILTKKTLKFMD